MTTDVARIAQLIQAGRARASRQYGAANTAAVDQLAAEVRDLADTYGIDLSNPDVAEAICKVFYIAASAHRGMELRGVEPRGALMAALNHVAAFAIVAADRVLDREGRP